MPVARRTIVPFPAISVNRLTNLAVRRGYGLAGGGMITGTAD